MRTQYKVVDKVGRSLRLGYLGLHHQRTEGLQGDIVRRCTIESFVASLDYEQVAVLHTRVEADAVVAQLLLQVLDKHIGLLGSNVSRRVVLEDIAFDAHEVAASGNLIGSKFNANICGFEYSPTLIHCGHIITQHRHVGHLTTGMEAIGYGLEHTRTSHTGQTVHIRGMGILHQGFIT